MNKCKHLVVNDDDPRHKKYPDGGFNRHCTHPVMVEKVKLVSPTEQYCWEMCRLYEEGAC